MPLQIKSQGFPTVIAELGIQSPTVGPFWGFEPTVLPTFQIGSSNVQHISGMPYLRADINEQAVANPAALATLSTTPSLVGGRYGVAVNWTFENQSAGGSTILFQVYDSSSTLLRTIPLAMIAPTGTAAAFGYGEHVFVEDIQEGDFVILQNLSLLVSATVRTALRWNRINPLSFVPPF